MQYIIRANGRPMSNVFTCFDPKPIVYDDVVDKSQFRPDSENVRNKILASSGGSMMNGVYDTSDDVSREEVIIRSGKLDRVEIQKILDSKVDEFATQNEEDDKKKKLEEAKKVADARQDYLDNLTGFHGVPQE